MKGREKLPILPGMILGRDPRSNCRRTYDSWQNLSMNTSMRSTAWAAAAVLGVACGGASASAQTAPPVGKHGGARAGGIWKAVVPPAQMTGEFDSFDPIGVAVGARIKADCSINWINPDDGARYCFSSGTSLEFFLDSPHASIERARAGWRKMSAAHK
jgi:hypothetical protein